MRVTRVPRGGSLLDYLTCMGYEGTCQQKIVFRHLFEEGPLALGKLYSVERGIHDGGRYKAVIRVLGDKKSPVLTVPLSCIIGDRTIS